MYRGFELKWEATQTYINESQKYLSSYLESIKKEVRSELDEFFTSDKVINGSIMQEKWFPQIKADVFISHSHKDYDTAVALAAYLKSNHGLNVFIDSCVWGYSDDLLKLLDNEFCKNSTDDNYSYEMRNYSTSHVHMMLSTALTKMMDGTECLIFLNTGNSISTSDIKDKTLSPWIYSEISTSRLLKRHKPIRYRRKEKKFDNLLLEKAQMYIEYGLDKDHLDEISITDITGIINAKKGDEHPLDVLYKIVDNKE